MDVSKLAELINDSGSPWGTDNETILKKPYTHISEQEGKKFRTKLIMIFNHFYKLPTEINAKLSLIIEILHTSSLLIDDIEDNSTLRRGVKTSHLVYGVPMTINSANYMYFEAMKLIPELVPQTAENNALVLQADLFRIFNDEICNLHRGQGLDIYWRDNGIIPTEKMYFDMVIKKTGGLFRLTIKLMERLSKFYSNCSTTLQRSLVPLCNILGVIYQIRDDYLNLSDDKMRVSKGFAEDITEGKLSFPIIHGLNYEIKLPKEDHFLLNIILSKTTDNELKHRVIDFLKNESNSLEYSKETVKNLAIMIKKGDYLPKNGNNEEIILQLHYIIDHLSNI